MIDKDFEIEEELHITDDACDWIEKNAQLFMTTDLSLAYAFSITRKIMMITTIDGSMWDFINIKTRKQLTEKQIYRLLKKLVNKYEFMEWRIEPFPEYARDKNFQYDIDTALIVDTGYFEYE